MEKANDLIVGQRQKHNGMSWSFDGSGALTAINMLLLNGEEEQWVRNGYLSFPCAKKMLPKGTIQRIPSAQAENL